jgi:hypothetical protein
VTSSTWHSQAEFQQHLNLLITCHGKNRQILNSSSYKTSQNLYVYLDGGDDDDDATHRHFLAFKPPTRSPLRYKRAPGDLSRGTACRPSNANTRSTRFLTPIREESPRLRRHSRHSRSFTDYRNFDDTLYDEPDDVNTKEEGNDADESDFEDSFFHWEEESTLFSDLMEEE